jgi:histidyl-tRNA synthetase
MTSVDYLNSSILPEKSWKWQKLENKIHQITKLFNFKEIRPAIVQERSSIKECFKFKDKNSCIALTDYVYELKDDDLVLRPEATLQILSTLKDQIVDEEPQRLYYFGPMFRKGDTEDDIKQFHQFGCEFIGSEKVLAEIELIRMGLKFFEELGLFDVKIELTSYGCSVCKPLIEADREAMNDLKQDNAAKKIRRSNHLCQSCRKKMYNLQKLMSNLMINWDENSSLQRIFKYYNNTVFNFVYYEGDKKIILGGGGRYDFLASQIIERPYHATGFSIDIEPLMEIVERKNVFTSRKSDHVTYFAAENESVQLQLLQVTQDFVKENMPFIINSDFGVSADFVSKARFNRGLGIVSFEDDLANEGKAKIVNIVKDKEEIVPIGDLLEYFLRLKKSIVHTMHY